MALHWEIALTIYKTRLKRCTLSNCAGADGVRHRPLRRVVRGVHGELRTRASAARAARQRAALSQDARRLPSSESLLLCTHLTRER